MMTQSQIILLKSTFLVYFTWFPTRNHRLYKESDSEHTSIRSLFAPSEMAARLSYCSGSNSLRAAVRYSPAGVVLTCSPPDLTNAMVPWLLSRAKGEGGILAERPSLLSVLSKIIWKRKNKILINTPKKTQKKYKHSLEHKKLYLPKSRAWALTGPLGNGLDTWKWGSTNLRNLPLGRLKVEAQTSKQIPWSGQDGYQTKYRNIFNFI